MQSFYLFFNMLEKKINGLIVLHYFWNVNQAKQIMVMFSVISSIIISKLSSVIHLCFLQTLVHVFGCACMCTCVCVCVYLFFCLPSFKVTYEIWCIHKLPAVWYVWQGELKSSHTDFTEKKIKQATTKYGFTHYKLEWRYDSFCFQVSSWQ